MSIRALLTVIAIAFAVYQAVRGVLFWGAPPEKPVLLVILLAAYLAIAIAAVYAVPRQKSQPEPEEPAREPMPMWAAILVLISSAALALLTTVAIGDADADATYGTWFIGGVGALLVVVMVRRRPGFAWAGIIVLSAVSVTLRGPEAFGQGLVGSIVWVGVAQLVVVLLDRAARDAAELGELQAVTSAWEAAHDGRERERRIQLQRALAVGGPMLGRIVASHGDLTDDERREAGMAEARLRDELRGARLLDDDVRERIEQARRRGSHVSVFDEGGLDGLDDEGLRAVRAELVEALEGAASERLIIRTSPHEWVVVTVVGRHREDGEDVVDLWREIEAPRR